MTLKSKVLQPEVWPPDPFHPNFHGVRSSICKPLPKQKCGFQSSEREPVPWGCRNRPQMVGLFMALGEAHSGISNISEIPGII